MTPRPHDALFKSAFEAPADAAALVRELLPTVLQEVIAWTRCTARPGRWTTSRSLDDMFDPSVLAIPSLSASIPRSPLIVDDLAGLSNDDLKARAVAAFQKLALWLLRDARAPRRLLDNFETWIETFAEAGRAPAGIDATATLLTCMFRVIDPMHHHELRAKIHQLGPLAEETTMTIAEKWHEEGRIAALRSLLISKFGAQALDATYEAHLQAATPPVVDHYLQRVRSLIRSPRCSRTDHR